MKLTFLGTGAADWDIGAFTPDAPFRRFSGTLVGDDLIIDPGPHIFHFAEHNGTPDMFANVKNIIVTHSHADHFNADTVRRLCIGRDCTLWGDPVCLTRLRKDLGDELASRIRFEVPELRQTHAIGNYEVTVLPANHVTEYPEETARMYLVKQDDRTLWWTGDSAWVPTESWNIIRDQAVNTAVLELTCGETAPDDWRIFEHNTLDMLELMLRMFRKYNRFAPDIKYYVTHMARTLHTDHDTLVKTLAPLDVTPAYDGLSIEI